MKWSQGFSSITYSIHASMTQENSDFYVKSPTDYFYTIEQLLIRQSYQVKILRGVA